MMVEHGVYLDATLSPEARVVEHGQEELGADDEQWNWTLKLYDAMYDSVARAHRIGVKIAAGSDPYMPYVRHGELGFVLEQLVKAGLTPMEAIVAATKTGAEVLDMADEVGTVEEGKLADLVVLDGDPLDDIRILQDKANIKKVIKGGKVVVDRP
jgi:imidazolonepropionase-like amidohydrolase